MLYFFFFSSIVFVLENSYNLLSFFIFLIIFLLLQINNIFNFILFKNFFCDRGIKRLGSKKFCQFIFIILDLEGHKNFSFNFFRFRFLAKRGTTVTVFFTDTFFSIGWRLRNAVIFWYTYILYFLTECILSFHF